MCSSDSLLSLGICTFLLHYSIRTLALALGQVKSLVSGKAKILNATLTAGTSRTLTTARLEMSYILYILYTAGPLLNKKGNRSHKSPNT